MTIELAWKTLKDYLEAEGYIVNSPRQAIKTAFKANLISDADLWLAALSDRNLTFIPTRRRSQWK